MSSPATVYSGPYLFSLAVLLPLCLTSAVAEAAEPLCPEPCSIIVDYQQTDNSLTFFRTRKLPQVSVSTTNSTRAGESHEPSNWRHNYEVILTQHGSQRIIFDQWGNKHTFTLAGSGRYQPYEPDSGQLTLDNRYYTWSDSQGVRYRFAGSFPDSVHDNTGMELSLSYDNRNRLSRVSDVSGNQIQLLYRGNSLSALIWPDGSIHPLALESERSSANCIEPENEHSDALHNAQNDDSQGSAPEQCDTEAHPVPGFNAIPAGDFVSVLDARPASCRSFFVDYYGTDRGDQIESALAEHPPYSDMTATVHSFPGLDFYNDAQWLAVVTRDLASATFNNPDTPDALFYRLLRDGEIIHSRFLSPLRDEGVISVTELGTSTTIEAANERPLTLQLIIRQGMAGPAHWSQINQARQQLWQRYGIHLEVLIIP